jgi:hypothetical protein
MDGPDQSHDTAKPELFGSSAVPGNSSSQWISGCPILRVFCEGWDPPAIYGKKAASRSADPTLRKKREGWGTRRSLTGRLFTGLPLPVDCLLVYLYRSTVYWSTFTGRLLPGRLFTQFVEERAGSKCNREQTPVKCASNQSCLQAFMPGVPD